MTWLREGPGRFLKACGVCCAGEVRCRFLSLPESTASCSDIKSCSFSAAAKGYDEEDEKDANIWMNKQIMQNCYGLNLAAVSLYTWYLIWPLTLKSRAFLSLTPKIWMWIIYEYDHDKSKRTQDLIGPLLYDLISLRSILPPAKRTVHTLQNVFWLKAIGLNSTHTQDFTWAFSLSSASVNTASEDPFQNCSHLCISVLSKVRGHLRTRGARLQCRVWFNPDSSCPDFFSHVSTNCEGDPGSNSCRYPHPVGRGNTKHAHSLYGSSLFPWGCTNIIKHMKAYWMSTLDDRQMWTHREHQHVFRLD